MLIGLYLPIVQLVPLMFLMVPLMIMALKLETVRFWVHYFAVMLIIYLLMGMLAGPLAVISLLFVIPAFAMAQVYKRKQPARTAVTAGIIGMIGVMLIALLLTSAGGINVMKEFGQFMKESVQTFPTLTQGLLTEAYLEEYVSLVVRMLPMLIITMAVFYAFVTHAAVRFLLRKSDQSIPRLRPIREWRLPKSLVWYYLIALVLQMVFRNADKDTLIFTVLVNLIPLLMFAFAIQAIGFLFYWAHVKGWGKLLPIAGIVLFVLVPPLHTVYSLFGVFDVAFPLRDRLQK